MRLIKPYAELYPQEDWTLEGIYRQIEKCARVSYKSEDKITEDSSKKFVDNLIKAGHYAPLEFGTVYLNVFPEDDFGEEIIRFFFDTPYSRYQRIMLGDIGYVVTTNFRVIVENHLEEAMKYLCAPTEYHAKRPCVKFVTDIGTAREFTRHRVFSFMQESTRYVGYSKRKPIKEYNCDTCQDICNAYSQGYSMREIAENSSLSEWEVRKILIDNKIQIRGLNNKGNRIDSYFNTIDTPEKAYLLGIIQTDGSVRNSRTVSLSITQHEDYAWYIKDMLLNFSDYINETKDRNCKQLIIGSSQIVNDLINIGIVPNKSKIQTDDNVDTLWNAIPEEFKGDFIRGLFDGDGYVTFFTQKKAINESCNIGFCSTSEHLIDTLIEFFQSKFNYKCGKGKDGNVSKLWITNLKKAKEIGTYLYQNFKYPFGHPKKTASWIKRLNKHYDIAEYKDSSFKIILPYWIESADPFAVFNFLRATSSAEDAYSALILKGWKPQEARQVLPLATKTELVMCGFEEDWEHFFDLRMRGTTGAPHPDAKYLATETYNLLNKK